jgi:hypothetical protein
MPTVSDPPTSDESGKTTSRRVAVTLGTKDAANPVTSPRTRKFSIKIELFENVFPDPRFVATTIAFAGRAVQEAKTTSARSRPIVGFRCVPTSQPSKQNSKLRVKRVKTRDCPHGSMILGHAYGSSWSVGNEDR